MESDILMVSLRKYPIPNPVRGHSLQQFGGPRETPTTTRLTYPPTSNTTPSASNTSCWTAAVNSSTKTTQTLSPLLEGYCPRLPETRYTGKYCASQVSSPAPTTPTTPSTCVQAFSSWLRFSLMREHLICLDARPYTGKTNRSRPRWPSTSFLRQSSASTTQNSANFSRPGI